MTGNALSDMDALGLSVMVVLASLLCTFSLIALFTLQVALQRARESRLSRQVVRVLNVVGKQEMARHNSERGRR